MESCIGCPSNDGLCVDYPKRYKKKCPCSKCLIKNMCEEPCEKYDEFIDRMEELGY